MVVERDHPSWAEVNAEQQERIGYTDGRETRDVANNWAFWIGLIGAFAVLYVLPTLIGVLRPVESLTLVVIVNLFPIAWPAALAAACMMPRQEGC
jgi:hypothetical protein